MLILLFIVRFISLYYTQIDRLTLFFYLIYFLKLIEQLNSCSNVKKLS